MKGYTRQSEIDLAVESCLTEQTYFDVALGQVKQMQGVLLVGAIARYRSTACEVLVVGHCNTEQSHSVILMQASLAITV